MEMLSVYSWVMPLAIFFARVLDVTLGTLRTIMVFRGYRLFAAIMGFFEVAIWILASAKVLTDINQHWHLVFFYCAGYAAGNSFGIWVESKLAVGSALVTAVSETKYSQLVATLRDNGFSVTELAGKNCFNVPVGVVMVVEKRRNVKRIVRLIEESDPDAFYTIEDVRATHARCTINPRKASRLSMTGLLSSRKFLNAHRAVK